MTVNSAWAVSAQKAAANPTQILGTQASATLRDQLMGGLKEIASSDDAAVWARRTLSAKNSLTEVDAGQVEAAFEAKLATLERSTASRRDPPRPRLTHPESRRFRDKGHVKFVAKQACLICGRRPADAHHLRFGQHRALSRKVSDLQALAHLTHSARFPVACQPR
jgi:hypothetical protein